MRKIVQKIQSLRSRNSEKEVFENKIFSIITFVVAISCFLSFIPYIYIHSFFLMNLIGGLLGITFSVFFYLSFFRGITQPLILPFQILVAFGLTLNWFYFQGTEGSIPLLFFPATFLLIYSNREKKYWPILISSISFAIVLVVIHYLYPDLAMPYADRNSRIIDLSISFILSLFAFGYATMSLKKNFDFERSKTEQKNRELHELNVTKNKFFSIISHDLRNPFNAIIGFSNILVEQVQEKNYEGIGEYARIVQGSSQRAMDLLTNLLEWSRSQTGRMEFAPDNIEIVGLINEVTELANDAAQHKLITISKVLPHSATVFADKAMIGTVLRNLISNAIKFTNSGGTIVISAEQKPDELLVTVSDNGVGIKNDTIEKLFRIDENNSTAGTQNEEGTGLGLILCKEFVEKHGGTIWVESEIGKGSKFSFTISLNQMNVGESEY